MPALAPRRYPLVRAFHAGAEGRAVIARAIGHVVLAVLGAGEIVAERLDAWAAEDATGARRLLLARASAATAILDRDREWTRARRLARRARRRAERRAPCAT